LVVAAEVLTYGEGVQVELVDKLQFLVLPLTVVVVEQVERILMLMTNVREKRLGNQVVQVEEVLVKVVE
jgi:hypothetical protein